MDRLFDLATWQLLCLLLSTLALGAFAFTNEYYTNDMESWLFTALSSDASGVLTFINPNFRPWPAVVLVPTDGSMAANGINVSGGGTAIGAGFPAANPYVSGVTIAQTTGVGAGQGRIIVIRRR